MSEERDATGASQEVRRFEPPRRRARSLTFPLLLIGLGVIFLLNTLGVWDVQIVPLLARWWPAIIILIGLDILLGRRSLLGSLIVAALVVGTLFAAVWFASALVPGAGTPIVEQASGTLDASVESLDATLTFDVGSFELDTLPTSSEAAAEVELRRSTGPALLFDYREAGGRATLVAGAEVPESGFAFMPDVFERSLSASLSPTPATALKADSGVGEMRLDLDNMTLQSLDADLGVGLLQVELPEEGDFEADLSLGIGELEVIVPPGLDVRIERDTGIVGSDIDGSRFVRDGEAFETPGFDSASSRVVLRVDVGIGSLQVR